METLRIQDDSDHEASSDEESQHLTTEGNFAENDKPLTDKSPLKPSKTRTPTINVELLCDEETPKKLRRGQTQLKSQLNFAKKSNDSFSSNDSA